MWTIYRKGLNQYDRTGQNNGGDCLRRGFLFGGGRGSGNSQIYHVVILKGERKKMKNDPRLKPIIEFVEELRKEREGMKYGGCEEGIPQLTDKEIKLLAYVDYLEWQVNNDSQGAELAWGLFALEKKRRERLEGEQQDYELKAGQYEKLKAEFDFAYSLMSDDQKKEWAAKVHIVKPSFIKVVEE